jgi:hypothetical protein
MQRVVNRRERNRNASACRLFVKLLGGKMPLTLPKQELSQRQPLARRAQSRRANPLVDFRSIKLA